MDHRRIIFEGVASRVTLPGDYGEFEVLDFHKTIISLLVKGDVIIDDTNFPISKGIAKYCKGELVALVEL
jgi:F0F1-type ATP synthase epsilon subunit